MRQLRQDWNKIGLSIAASLFAAGCGTSDPPVQSREEPLYVLSTKVWTNRVIPVCWETSGNDTEKGWVRQAVEQSWQRNTGVTFSDWGTCTTTTNAGLRIRTADEWPHTAGLGTDLNNRVNGVVLNFWYAFQAVNDAGALYQPFVGCTGAAREGCIRSIGVHEFGHALGFAHEQNRGDTPGTCTNAPQGPNGDLVTGAWDLTSVMNYCNPTYNNNGQLSSRDIAGATSLYGMPPVHDLCITDGATYTRTTNTCAEPTTQAPCDRWDIDLGMTVTERPLSCGPGRREPRYFITRTCRREATYGVCASEGQAGAPIAGVSRHAANLDTFFIGRDGGIWSRWSAGSGGGAAAPWRPFRVSAPGVAPAGGKLAVVSRRPGYLDVFFINNGGQISTSWWAGGAWTTGPIGATPVPAPAGGAVSVVARGADALDLFYVANDGALWSAWWRGGAWAFGAVTGPGQAPAGGATAVVSPSPNYMELYHIGNDGALWEHYWTGGPWTPVRVNAPNTARPGATVRAVSRAPGIRDVFFVGNNEAVHTSWWDGAVWHTDALTGVWHASPGGDLTVTARAPGNLDVFYVGLDRAVHTLWWSGAWGGGPLSPPGVAPVGAGISAVSRTADNLEVFVSGNSGGQQTLGWSPATGWRGPY